MTVEVLQNAALLLAMAYLYDLVFLTRRLRETIPARVVVGAGLGVIAMGVMASSWELMPGVIIDTRSVLLAAAGLFFGVVPTVVAVAVAAAYRLHQGGSGSATGVSVIVISALIGLAWGRQRRERLSRLRVSELYLLGVVVHAVMLLTFIVVPVPDPFETVRRVGPAVMLIHPVAFTLIGLLMVNRLNREEVASTIEESESRYRSIFENQHLAMLIVDPADGRIVDANPPAASLYGWPPAVMRTMTVPQIHTLPAADVLRLMRAAHDGDRQSFHVQHRVADGTVRDVEVLSGPLRMSGRDLLLSIVLDVTERRRTETALQDAERQLQRLIDEAERSQRTLSATLEEVRKLSHAVEQSPASVVITDVRGNMEYVNRRFTEVTGYDRVEVMGQNPRILKSGLTPEETYRSLWETVSSGATWRGELHNRAKDGRLFWERAVISPLLDDDGVIVRYIAVKEDITAERALLEQLRQAQKMEAIGRLAGGVAHDFNNKLQVILGYSQLLAQVVTDEAVRKHLREIERAADQSAALTRQLLAFARRQPMQPEVIDLNEGIAGSLALIRRLLGEDIALEWDPYGSPCPVVMDPGQLDQVVTNLVVNARDAMPDGGRLVLRTGTSIVTDLSFDESADASPGEFVLLEVADSGTGIDEAVLANIFEPFVTTKGAGRGTGLGLATVYGIVKQNGGFIRLHSQLGRGASFQVHLPRSVESPTADEPVAALPVTGGSETILLVEDEPAILGFVEQTLHTHGYRVLAEPNGRAALDRVRANGEHVSLLLTDVVMPDMNGHELGLILRGLVPGLRVLYMSGYTADVIARRGVFEDDEPLLAKPFTPRELLEQVREVLDGPSGST